MDAEVALLDEGVGPDFPHQVVLADQLAARFDQRNQEVEGAAPEPHRLVAFDEQLPRRIEPERPEGQTVIGGGGGGGFVGQERSLGARAGSADSYMRASMTVKPARQGGRRK